MKKLKVIKKKNKKNSNFKIFTKKPKELTNKQLSDVLPFLPKKPKRRTKYQILSNILPFFDTAGISRKQYAFRNYAGTYGVEVMDTKSLDDSLFSAKRSIIDLFRDLLEEKRGFTYVLPVRVTL